MTDCANHHTMTRGAGFEHADRLFTRLQYASPKPVPLFAHQQTGYTGSVKEQLCGRK